MYLKYFKRWLYREVGNNDYRVFKSFYLKANKNLTKKKLIKDKKKIDFIDMYQYREDVLLEDGHHLNAKGSSLLAEKLFKVIQKNHE